MILLAGLANGHKIVDTIDLPDSDFWCATGFLDGRLLSCRVAGLFLSSFDGVRDRKSVV